MVWVGAIYAGAAGNGHAGHTWVGVAEAAVSRVEDLRRRMNKRMLKDRLK